MSILLFTFIPLWLLTIGKEILFWTYLWQLKEYRKDRMRAHFAMPEARAFLANNRIKVVALLFALSIFALAVPVLPIVLGIGAVLFYTLGAYRIYIHISEGQLRRPIFTAKAVLLAGASSAVYAGVFIAAVSRGPEIAFTILFGADLAVPLITTFFVALLKPVSVMFKNRTLNTARRKRENLRDLLVVGITGSFGKTSTKDFLAHMLDKKFRVHKTPEHVNTEMGIARDFLRNVSSTHDMYIAEMGAYRMGEIAAAADVVRPDIAVLTGISNQHIALFGSRENIQKAKYELIESLREGGLAIFNGDNKEARDLFSVYRKAKRLYASSLPEQGVYGGIFAKDIRYKADSTSIEITDRKETVRMEIPLVGYAHTINVLGAATVAHALGMNLSAIADRAKTLTAPARTMEPRRGIKGTRVIDDSYSGNLEGALAALYVLAQAEGNKKICILRPLIELGEEGEGAHKELGAKIGASCDICIVTTKDYFAELQEHALSAGMEKEQIMHISDPYLAMRKAQECIEEGDIVLLENRIPEQVRQGVLA